MKKKESKIVEDVKVALVLKGQKASETIKGVLADLAKLKAPNTHKFHKKNNLYPFEDATQIEFYSDKCDASLFVFGSHSSKRPDNLVIGRLFNHRMLDMVEFGVKDFKSLDSFKVPKHNINSRTCVIFQGEEFENNADFKQIGNILLDYFVEQPTDYVNLACLDHVVIFTSTPSNTILMRHYSVVLKKSGSRIPRIELSEIGPSMDLEVRRSRFAGNDLREQANKHFAQRKSKSKKNVSKDSLSATVGNIHIGSQNMGEMQQKRPKALRQTGKRQEVDGEEQTQRKRVKTSKEEDN